MKKKIRLTVFALTLVAGLILIPGFIDEIIIIMAYFILNKVYPAK